MSGPETRTARAEATRALPAGAHPNPPANAVVEP